MVFEGDQVVIQKSTTAPDPFVLFHKYLVSRDSHFALFPQLWLRSNGSVPSRSWFLSRLHSVFPRSIGGHSMRAGGATSLAAAGHLKSRQLGDGDPTLLSAIFITIQHCCRLSCSMVGPFINPHLLMYHHSLLATLPINSLSPNTQKPYMYSSLPPFPI